MLTYALIILLWYPSDNYIQSFEVGTKLTHAQCEAAMARATQQLQASLSTAELVGVRCEPNRSA